MADISSLFVALKNVKKKSSKENVDDTPSREDRKFSRNERVRPEAQQPGLNTKEGYAQSVQQSEKDRQNIADERKPGSSGLRSIIGCFFPICSANTAVVEMQGPVSRKNLSNTGEEKQSENAESEKNNLQDQASYKVIAAAPRGNKRPTSVLVRTDDIDDKKKGINLGFFTERARFSTSHTEAISGSEAEMSSYRS